jgi:hypothetical protein
MQVRDITEENESKRTPAEESELWNKQLAGLLDSLKSLLPTYFNQDWSVYDNFFKMHITNRYQQTLAYKIFINLLRFATLATLRVLSQYPTTEYSKFSKAVYDEVLLDVIISAQGFQVLPEKMADSDESHPGAVEQLESFKLFVNQLDLFKAIVGTKRDPAQMAEMIAGLDLFYMEVGKKLKLVHMFLEAVEKKENHIPTMIAFYAKQSQFLCLDSDFQPKILKEVTGFTCLTARHNTAIHFFQVLFETCHLHLSVIKHARAQIKAGTNQSKFMEMMWQLKSQLNEGNFANLEDRQRDMLMKGLMHYYVVPVDEIDVVYTAITQTFDEVAHHLQSLREFTMHWDLMEYNTVLTHNADALPDHKLANKTFEEVFGYEDDTVFERVLDVTKRLLKEATRQEVLPEITKMLKVGNSLVPVGGISAPSDMLDALNADLLSASEENARKAFERSRQAALEAVENAKKHFEDVKQLNEQLLKSYFKTTNAFTKMQNGLTDIQLKIDSLSVPSEFTLTYSKLFNPILQEARQAMKDCRSFLPKQREEIKTQRKMTEDSLRSARRREEKQRLIEEKAQELAKKQAEEAARVQAESADKERALLKAQEKSNKKQLAKAQQALEKANLDVSGEFISPAPSPGAISEGEFTPLSLSIISTDRQVSSCDGFDGFSSPEPSPTASSSTAQINAELEALASDAKEEAAPKTDRAAEAPQEENKEEWETLQCMTKEIIPDPSMCALETGNNVTQLQEPLTDEFAVEPAIPELPPLRPRDLPIGCSVPPGIKVSDYPSLFGGSFLTILNNSLEYRQSGKKMFTQYALDAAQPQQSPPAEPVYSASMRNA